MAIIDVEDLVGTRFNLPDDDGNPRDAEILEAILEHDSKTQKDSTHTKF